MEPELAEYLQVVRNLEREFQGFTVVHVPRGENESADALAKAAAQGTPLPPKVFFHTATTPATASEGSGTSWEVAVIFSEDWRSPIITFQAERYDPEGHTEMRQL